MPTLNQATISSGRSHNAQGFGIVINAFSAVLAGMLLLLLGSCAKEQGMEAIETDANGYFCTKCGAKLYTDRRVFLEKCPECKEDSLVAALGYMCKTDHQLTIRPKISGPEGAPNCNRCGARLNHALFEPHKKDLEAWGATKAGLQ